MRTRTLWTLLAVLALPVASRANAQTFDFESTVPLTLTPFSITKSGLTATFASTGGDIAGVLPVSLLGGITFSTLSGNVLLNVGSNPFAVLLSQTRTGVSLNFAIDSGSSISLIPFLGMTPVGAVITEFGSVPSGGIYSEGVLTFSGAAFDGFLLVPTQQPLFFIDNVSLQSAVPEPSTMALLLGGGVLLLGGSAARRRRPTA